MKFLNILELWNVVEWIMLTFVSIVFNCSYPWLKTWMVMIHSYSLVFYLKPLPTISTFPGLPVTTYLSPTLELVWELLTHINISFFPCLDLSVVWELLTCRNFFFSHVLNSPLDVDRPKGTEGQVRCHMLQNDSLHMCTLSFSFIEKSLSIH